MSGLDGRFESDGRAGEGDCIDDRRCSEGSRSSKDGRRIEDCRYSQGCKVAAAGKVAAISKTVTSKTVYIEESPAAMPKMRLLARRNQLRAQEARPARSEPPVC
jgi:hypothetical protein